MVEAKNGRIVSDAERNVEMLSQSAKGEEVVEADQDQLGEIEDNGYSIQQNRHCSTCRGYKYQYALVENSTKQLQVFQINFPWREREIYCSESKKRVSGVDGMMAI
jgi:hypothetical protein